MKRSTEQMLTTHTGSLPRPRELVQALNRRDRGETDGGDIDELIRDAVADVVLQQAEAGVTVVNDGEAGKVGYATYVKERLDGFDGESGAWAWMPPDLVDFPGYARRALGNDVAMPLMPTCTSDVSYTGVDALHADIANLKRARSEGADVEDLFMSAASPGVISLFLQNQHYDTHEQYVWALADAMKAEYDEIHRAGVVLQLDCPDLAIPTGLEGDDTPAGFQRRVRMHIEALNHATRDIPAEDMRMHLCWGNYEGPHHRDVPLRDIIEMVFQARPSAILFEGANPRHEHEWTVFDDVKLPDGKVLVPGVIDSTTNYIEHPELVAQRIIRYARLVGRENVIAGTDCGFATVAIDAPLPVDADITWAKLRAMAEGAALVSAELW